jgi:hypothetical protein
MDRVLTGCLQKWGNRAIHIALSIMGRLCSRQEQILCPGKGFEVLSLQQMASIPILIISVHIFLPDICSVYCISAEH